MKNLIKFELRKILTKRFAVISVAAVLLLSLILSFSTLHSMYAFDGNGAEETGKAAVEIDKQIALKYEGKLTDNKVQQISETSALYRIIVLMPLFYSQYISIMSVEQMHNGMLYAVWSIPVAIALVVIGSIISHKAFSKHQVR